MPDKRIENEIAHGRFLLENGAGVIWNWESPAGRLRWKRRVEMLSSTLDENSHVLELGCGTGYFTKELARLPVEVTAIDISPELIEKAKEDIRSENVTFMVQNAYKTDFNSNTFDAVIGSSVLHHLDANKAFAEIFRILKPGGKIAFTEPNKLNPQIALQKNIPWLKRRLGDSPDETAFFRWEIKTKLRIAGFHNIKINPFDFLHPALPPVLISSFSKAGSLAEKIIFLREIAGSLFIRAHKPD